MALCLSSGLLAATLALHSFTLAWTHSIEKIRWEEDWVVAAAGQGAAQLQLLAARIRGTGAGMEPPADALWHNGVWHYTPKLAPLDELWLGHAPSVADYELCTPAGCQTLQALLPGAASLAPEPYRLAPCPLAEPDLPRQ